MRKKDDLQNLVKNSSLFWVDFLGDFLGGTAKIFGNKFNKVCEKITHHKKSPGLVKMLSPNLVNSLMTHKNIRL